MHHERSWVVMVESLDHTTQGRFTGKKQCLMLCYLKGAINIDMSRKSPFRKLRLRMKSLAGCDDFGRKLSFIHTTKQQMCRCISALIFYSSVAI